MDYETDALLGPNYIYEKPQDQIDRDAEILQLQQDYAVHEILPLRDFLRLASQKNEPDVIKNLFIPNCFTI